MSAPTEAPQIFIVKRNRGVADQRVWYRCHGCGMVGNFVTTDDAFADSVIAVIDASHVCRGGV